ncbi:MAG: TonB-system energizer ExbB [Candidatus Scalindua sp.]|nr:TonB-system energizer ExbB [Candidatus Scalindua sp.]
MEIKLFVDYGIIGFLIFMSIVSLSLAIERYLTYRKIKIEDFAERKSLELVLTAKIHIIATIGSNAPYIGLLGTVAGLMFTFSSIGEEGYMDTGRIMIGLALALKATATGLLVAIPSVAFHNFILRKAKVLLMTWEIKNDGR